MLFVRGSSRGWGRVTISVGKLCDEKNRGECEGMSEGYTYTVCQVGSLMDDCDRRKNAARIWPRDKHERRRFVLRPSRVTAAGNPTLVGSPLCLDTHFPTNGGSYDDTFCSSSSIKNPKPFQHPLVPTVSHVLRPRKSVK